MVHQITVQADQAEEARVDTAYKAYEYKAPRVGEQNHTAFNTCWPCSPLPLNLPLEQERNSRMATRPPTHRIWKNHHHPASATPAATATTSPSSLVRESTGFSSAGSQLSVYSEAIHSACGSVGCVRLRMAKHSNHTTAQFMHASFDMLRMSPQRPPRSSRAEPASGHQLLLLQD